MVISSTAPITSNDSESLHTEIINLPENMELVDDKLIEKTGMTFKHSVTQANIARYWGNHIISSGQGGKVCTEAPCRTGKQTRRPDVAYITPKLLEETGDFTILPQSFPLIAEIASPDDSGEALFAKAKEYLDSGCQEVWLVFPESLWIIIITQAQHLLLTLGEVVNTQEVLPNFSVSVDELLA
ncbi:MAG: Uma2 family endonuclease [Coleofasciculaceae cyanobacterium]